jgi:hypothetical protein
MRHLAPVLLLLVACADGGDAITDETEVSADGALDASDPSVRAGDTTLSVSHDVTRRGDLFVLRGKTSRTLTDGRGFVFDDVYGAFAQKSPRTFELTWSTSEIRTLSDGVDQFIGLDFVHSSTRPDHLVGRVVVRPRLTAFTGSSKIYLVAEVTPVIVDGLVTYRISGHSTVANNGVELRVNGTLEGTVRRPSDTAFTVDLDPAQVIALTSGADMQFIVSFPDGGVEKHAHVGLAVKKLGMTAGDPEHVWPRPTCTTALKSCLLALPGDASDLASCGDAITVTACRGTIGVVIDDVAFQGALHDADVRLSTPAVHADAVGLVGASRADAFLGGAHQTIEQNLENAFGRWFLTTTARTAALQRALEGGIDTAYAYPLDLVTPSPVVAGNAAAMRQVVADAVLAELARMDLVHTEFGRSLEDLAHEYRAQHVSSIAAFRTTVSAEPYPGMPAIDVYIGDWLGTHVEVSVERATGKVTNTLVEID